MLRKFTTGYFFSLNDDIELNRYWELLPHRRHLKHGMTAIALNCSQNRTSVIWKITAIL
jgi:hypothetical protein